MVHRDLRCLQRTTLYQGRIIRLIREVFEYRGHRMVRETVLHPGAVVIIPMLDRSRVILVRQYRRAVGRNLLELPAGTRTPGEPRKRCAQRELEEETGWRAARLRQIGQFYAAPGMFSEQMTIFLAQGLKHTAPHPDPDEFLTPVILSHRTALAKIRSGEICDAKTIIGLLLVQRFLA